MSGLDKSVGHNPAAGTKDGAFDSHSRDTFYAVSLILRHGTADNFYGPGELGAYATAGCHSNSSQVDLRQVVSRKDCFVG
ncbi:hypothetical protein [Paenarthrobacter sp. CM16]|uniref:hypothetical protein n=1 Tax=Paenarthrobacter sp. CM16 TaxID=2738447 RepID=UPI0020A6B9DA|nr:hypothetical protein [Paenarthrobacter sp. CM16]